MTSITLGAEPSPKEVMASYAGFVTSTVSYLCCVFMATPVPFSRP